MYPFAILGRTKGKNSVREYRPALRSYMEISGCGIVRSQSVPAFTLLSFYKLERETLTGLVVLSV